MKLVFSSLLPILSLLHSASVANAEIVCEGDERRLSADLEGTLEISTGECNLKCEWGVNEDRRNLRSIREEKKQFTFFGRKLKDEVDGVKIDFVDCTLKWNETEYEFGLEWPEGWTEVSKSADDADDYYLLAKEFSVDLGGGCTVEAELEIELEVPEDDLGKEFLAYDDSDIGVSC
jgi:hypothetical protein